METTQDQLPIRAVGTCFRLIEALENRREAGVTELARELDISKGTVHKHLSTLQSLGYVERDNGAYRLGFRFLGIGERVRSHNQFCLAARPAIDNLAETTSATVSLMIHQHNLGVYAYRSGVTYDTGGFLPPVGGSVYLHATAGGKAILSQFSTERIDEVIEQRGLTECTEKTITTKDELTEELQSVRDRGLAFERGEHVPSIQCVGAPITTPSGSVASITAAGNIDKMSGKKLEEDIAGLVISASNAVEVSLLQEV
ncbi:IclR family transcriptional regulator [Halostagnicola bangensis]